MVVLERLYFALHCRVFPAAIASLAVEKRVVEKCWRRFERRRHRTFRGRACRKTKLVLKNTGRVWVFRLVHLPVPSLFLFGLPCVS